MPSTARGPFLNSRARPLASMLAVRLALIAVSPFHRRARGAEKHPFRIIYSTNHFRELWLPFEPRPNPLRHPAARRERVVRFAHDRPDAAQRRRVTRRPQWGGAGPQRPLPEPPDGADPAHARV